MKHYSQVACYSEPFSNQ